MGKQAAIAATENIENDTSQPYAFSTGPSMIYPKIEPNPAIPSLIPEIVEMAFF